ncbi:hypothetical protein BC567DRAFT_125 [Phyllosticta citribraziliensis]
MPSPPPLPHNFGRIFSFRSRRDTRTTLSDDAPLLPVLATVTSSRISSLWCVWAAAGRPAATAGASSAAAADRCRHIRPSVRRATTALTHQICLAAAATTNKSTSSKRKSPSVQRLRTKRPPSPPVRRSGLVALPSMLFRYSSCCPVLTPMPTAPWPLAPKATPGPPSVYLLALSISLSVCLPACLPSTASPEISSYHLPIPSLRDYLS